MTTEPVFKYAGALVPLLEGALQSRVGDCKKANDPSRPKSFGLVLRIGADGVVEDAWVDPEAESTLCVAKKLTGAKFDRPPFAPLHFYIDIGKKP